MDTQGGPWEVTEVCVRGLVLTAGPLGRRQAQCIGSPPARAADIQAPPPPPHSAKPQPTLTPRGCSVAERVPPPSSVGFYRTSPSSLPPESWLFLHPLLAFSLCTPKQQLRTQHRSLLFKGKVGNCGPREGAVGQTSAPEGPHWGS